MRSFKLKDKVVIREKEFLKHLTSNLSGLEAIIVGINYSSYLVDISIPNFFPNGHSLVQTCLPKEVKLCSSINFKYVI